MKSPQVLSPCMENVLSKHPEALCPSPESTKSSPRRLAWQIPAGPGNKKQSPNAGDRQKWPLVPHIEAQNLEYGRRYLQVHSPIRDQMPEYDSETPDSMFEEPVQRPSEPLAERATIFTRSHDHADGSDLFPRKQLGQQSLFKGERQQEHGVSRPYSAKISPAKTRAPRPAVPFMQKPILQSIQRQESTSSSGWLSGRSHSEAADGSVGERHQSWSSCFTRPSGRETSAICNPTYAHSSFPEARQTPEGVTPEGLPPAASYGSHEVEMVPCCPERAAAGLRTQAGPVPAPSSQDAGEVPSSSRADSAALSEPRRAHKQASRGKKAGPAGSPVPCLPGLSRWARVKGSPRLTPRGNPHRKSDSRSSLCTSRRGSAGGGSMLDGILRLFTGECCSETQLHDLTIVALMHPHDTIRVDSSHL